MMILNILHLQKLKQATVIKASYCFLTIIFLLFSSSCEKPEDQKPEPIHPIVLQIDASGRQWMEKFFQDIMLNESAIYTLWGSKPATVIVLQPYTDQQSNALLAKDPMVSVKSSDLAENWENWEDIRSKFPISKYLFFKHQRTDAKNTQELYFVNILETALLFQENYALFKQYVGGDFDPLEEVFNLQNQKSFIWHNDPFVHGMLFGYGIKNASCIEWKDGKHTSLTLPMKSFLNSLEFRYEEDPSAFNMPTINNFTLPIFASFSPEGKDPVIEKYKKEREEIKAIYRGKDFLNLTILKLTDEVNQPRM